MTGGVWKTTKIANSTKNSKMLLLWALKTATTVAMQTQDQIHLRVLKTAAAVAM
jgi:hypothetical protein